MKTNPRYCWRKRQSSPTSISKTSSARVGRLLQTSPTGWFVLRLLAKASILWIGHLFAVCHANLNCPLVLQLIYKYMFLIWPLDPTSRLYQVCMLLSDIKHGAVNFPIQKDSNSYRCSVWTGRWGKFLGQVSHMQHLTRTNNAKTFSYRRICLDGSSPFTEQQELLRFQSTKVLTANTQCRKRLNSSLPTTPVKELLSKAVLSTP